MEMKNWGEVGTERRIQSLAVAERRWKSQRQLILNDEKNIPVWVCAIAMEIEYRLAVGSLNVLQTMREMTSNRTRTKVHEPATACQGRNRHKTVEMIERE